MKGVVILDLDGVIINGQSQQIFLNYLFRKKIIGPFFYLKINCWFIFYKLGLLKRQQTIVDIMNYSFSFLKDKKTEDIEKIVGKFFNEKLHKFIFSEIIDIIKKYQAQDSELLIVSNAADVIVKKVAYFLSIKKYISTQLEIVDRKFTGKILGDIVYGKNKVNFTKKFIKNNNLDLKNSYAYADHISDLDLLLAVSNPCAVNPDGFLLSEAKKRNWPILIFKKISRK